HGRRLHFLYRLADATSGKAAMIARFTMAMFVVLGTTSLALAQGSSRKATIVGEDDQLLPRLHAVDRLIAWGESADAVARTVGLGAALGGPAQFLGPGAVLALENSSQEKWDQALEEYQQLLLNEGDALTPSLRAPMATGFQAASLLFRNIL